MMSAPYAGMDRAGAGGGGRTGDFPFAHGRVPAFLPERARLTPERPAFTWEGETVTFAGLLDAAERIADGLRERGIRPGDRVAVLAAGGARFHVALQACALAGAVIVPLNTRLTEEEQAFQLADAEVRVLLWDEPWAGRGASLLRRVGGSRPGIGGFSLPDRPWRERPRAGGPSLEGRDLSSVPEVDLSQPQSVFYTSGTTGRPKGAVLTWGNVLSSAVLQAFTLGMPADELYLAALPLFHVSGMAMLERSVLYGVRVEILDRFDPEVVNRLIDAGEVTALSVVGTVLSRMLEAHKDRPYGGRLRLVLFGGGPTPEPLVRKARELGLPVATTYGLTETASQCVTMPPDEMGAHIGAAGRPLPWTRVRIVGEGTILAPGAVGEIEVKGPMVMQGYLNRPDADRAAFSADGYLRTGDLGFLDPEGFLHVADRRVDLVVTGGENVYPAEVEAHLLQCEGVREACVVGVADERWGQRVVAAIVAGEREGDVPGLGAWADRLRENLRRGLAGYKVPREIRFVTELPHTAAGKLQRHVVREALGRLAMEDPAGLRGRSPENPWVSPPSWVRAGDGLGGERRDRTPEGDPASASGWAQTMPGTKGGTAFGGSGL